MATKSKAVLYTYRNISEQDQALIGVGVIGAGAEVEIDFVVENPNFEQVAKPKADKAKE